jgi:hypothetical protein
MHTLMKAALSRVLDKNFSQRTQVFVFMKTQALKVAQIATLLVSPLHLFFVSDNSNFS